MITGSGIWSAWHLTGGMLAPTLDYTHCSRHSTALLGLSSSPQMWPTAANWEGEILLSVRLKIMADHDLMI